MVPPKFWLSFRGPDRAPAGSWGTWGTWCYPLFEGCFQTILGDAPSCRKMGRLGYAFARRMVRAFRWGLDRR